mgnify:CR=1 FL=1
MAKKLIAKYQNCVTPAILLLVLILISCFVIMNGSKTYDERPVLSPAPSPATDQIIQHYETSYACGGVDRIYDQYYVNKSAIDVENYFLQEMEKYCQRRYNGLPHVFKPCLATEAPNCRYTRCMLKENQINSNEKFVVEIFEVSPIRSLVHQIHEIYYLPQKEGCTSPPGE